VFFFFSSRRRHTRFSRDWSSDVCSSDLSHWLQDGVQQPQERRQKLQNHRDHAGQRLGDRTQQRADLRADRLEPLAERLDDLLETRSDSLGDIRQERGQVGESPEQGLEDRGHSIAWSVERRKDLTERLLAVDGLGPPLERLSNRLDLVQQTARGILGNLEDAADALEDVLDDPAELGDLVERITDRLLQLTGLHLLLDTISPLLGELRERLAKPRQEPGTDPGQVAEPF